MEGSNLQVVYRAVADLKPYARNARTHSDAQIDQIAASIREFGFTNPILVGPDLGVIAGHGRLEAAKRAGMEQVPTIELAGLTDSQRKALVLADNRIALNSGWDSKILALEFPDLKAAGVDMAIMGFTTGELDALLGLSGGKTDPDDIPPAPAVPVSVPGDLWVLGGHRVLCGDSTNPAHLDRLMAGTKARLMNTDPPYGVAYDSSAIHAHGVDYGEIQNDDILDGEKLQAFLESAIRAAVPHLEDNTAFYLWHPMLTQGTFFAAAAAAAADILIHRQIIWVKPVLVFGRGDYHWKHELCFYGWRRGNRPEFYGERNQTTIWEIDSVSSVDRKEFAHATPKPVDLFVRPLKNHTKPGETCYEPFAGSGPQIIAAEMTERRCYAMEIAPRYVDVCVMRWQAFTGKTAVRESDGMEFNNARSQANADSAQADPGQPGPAAA